MSEWLQSFLVAASERNQALTVVALFAILANLFKYTLEFAFGSKELRMLERQMDNMYEIATGKLPPTKRKKNG
ncbi:MAG: hypothetical protein KGZ40_07085 [Clostridiales bacterium]|nr:hypothetical protein [Clostridiales bacterium]